MKGKTSLKHPSSRQQNSIFKKISGFCLKYKKQIIFVLLIATHVFLRFYLLLERASLGWDQVDSAWAAKKIIADHEFLLSGPVVKGNSGIYMGPLYFYLVSIFYFFTNLDPVASPIFQAVLSVVNLLILFYVTKKLFGVKAAFWAMAINTFSLTVLNSDRVQSAFYLIVPVSYLIFYTLYNVICGHEKYILPLAVFLGFSSHVDFTSILYPILVLFTLPFFPKTKKTLKYVLFSLPVFFIFLLPSILTVLQKTSSSSNSFLYLFNTFYHGIHLRRILQLSFDAFISIEQILQFRFLRSFVFFVLPIFMVIYRASNRNKKSFLLFYLISLWFLIPWLVMSTYSGELTDYYFSLPRDIVIAICAYLTVFMLRQKRIIFKIAPLFFWIIYALLSLQTFFNGWGGNLTANKEYVKQVIREGKTIPFNDHGLNSYLYYIYTRK